YWDLLRQNPRHHSAIPPSPTHPEIQNQQECLLHHTLVEFLSSEKHSRALLIPVHLQYDKCKAIRLANLQAQVYLSCVQKFLLQLHKAKGAQVCCAFLKLLPVFYERLSFCHQAVVLVRTESMGRLSNQQLIKSRVEYHFHYNKALPDKRGLSHSHYLR